MAEKANPGVTRLRWAIAGLIVVASVVGTGCTLTTAAAKPSLAHTFDSPRDLASAVLDALARNDLDELRALPLDETEFRSYVWPELPASRTQGYVPFDFVWGQLKQRSDGFLAQTVARYGGRRLELLDVAFEGDTTRYSTFVVHRGTTLHVLDEQGRPASIRLFGSVLVQNARAKLFSFVTN